MACMLPGVGVSPRKRMILMNHRCYHYHHRLKDGDDSIRNSREQFEIGISSNTMDETAARARKRLDLKLAYFHPFDIRSAKHQPHESRSSGKNAYTAQAEEPRIGFSLLKKLWRALPTH